MITPLPPHPAALLKAQKTRTLVIADLHIGWEMTLSEKGIHVPTQTPKLLNKLLNIIHAYKPQGLLILGDAKHTVATAEISEWQDIPDFFTELKKHVNEIQIIRGNHDGNLDPLLPENVKNLQAPEITINGVGFFHGHRWPSPKLLKCNTIVMGHVHPVVAFLDPAGFRITRQVWVKTSCNTTELAKILLQRQKIKIKNNPIKTMWKHYKIKPRTSQLFIMPSFNEFLGGRPLNQRKTYGGGAVGPVLRSEVVDMEKAEAYLLDGTFLGYLNQLRTFS